MELDNGMVTKDECFRDDEINGTGKTFGREETKDNDSETLSKDYCFRNSYHTEGAMHFTSFFQCRT